MSGRPSEQPPRPRLFSQTSPLSALPPLPLWPIVLFGVGLAVAVAASATQPVLTLGVAAAAGVFVLAFRHPTANLAVLVFLTAVVPYDVLNRFSVAGGANSPGLLLSDVFLLAGLAWAALTLPQLPLDRRRLWYGIAMTAFLLMALSQFVHGLRSGYVTSVVGQETRALLGFGTFLIALPLLAHRPTWRRLLAALAVGALLLGAWGMVQWFGNFAFGSPATSACARVCASRRQAPASCRVASSPTRSRSSGASQRLRTARPAVVILADSDRRRSGAQRASCLVTFERSFWLDVLAGLGSCCCSRRPDGAGRRCWPQPGRRGRSTRGPVVVRAHDRDDRAPATELDRQLLPAMTRCATASSSPASSSTESTRTR